MGLRLYLCDVIGDGFSPATAFRTGLQRTALVGSEPNIRTDATGAPAFTWHLHVARAANWSVQDADATLVRLFDAADLPDTIDTWAELRAFLQSKTVGDIPLARRQALNSRLTARGIDTSSVTLATTWWQVLRGVVKQLNGGVLPAGDGIGI